MTDRLLHSLAIPENARTESRDDRQRRVSKQGQLGSGPGVARSISLEPGQQLLTGYYSGKFAALQERMIEELFDAGGIEVVPYAGRTTQTADDGYYVLENITTERPDPRVADFNRFDGRLTKKGTRSSHWRAVRTAVQTESNPFGSAATPEFGLVDRASKVRWYDAEGGTLEDATAQRTVDGEHDPIAIYDASEPSFDDPVLLYTLPYSEEWPTDCRVWDTYDRSKVYRETQDITYHVGDADATVGTATVGQSVTLEVASQWQRVFTTDHNWRGDTVLENDVLRLEIDRPETRLKAYRWDGRDEIYEVVQLGASSWRVSDLNVKRIGLATIEAQVEFSDSSGSTHNLNLDLYRGLEDSVWTNPSNEGAVPSGLTDRLDPIAATTDDVPIATDDVIERDEVDR
jgi:hypothetical protein